MIILQTWTLPDLSSRCAFAKPNSSNFNWTLDLFAERSPCFLSRLLAFLPVTSDLLRQLVLLINGTWRFVFYRHSARLLNSVRYLIAFRFFSPRSPFQSNKFGPIFFQSRKLADWTAKFTFLLVLSAKKGDRFFCWSTVKWPFTWPYDLFVETRA